MNQVYMLCTRIYYWDLGKSFPMVMMYLGICYLVLVHYVVISSADAT